MNKIKNYKSKRPNEYIVVLIAKREGQSGEFTTVSRYYTQGKPPIDKIYNDKVKSILADVPDAYNISIKYITKL